MTKNSPRIYIYKITFEEVRYYYYGVHKEKKFGEYYMGSPKTHKWVWDFYTPKKQILQFFDFTEEGWLEANKIEKRIIRPFYNNDKWCLNENCGGFISMEAKRKSGMYCFRNKIGIHALTKEQRSEQARKINAQKWMCLETGFITNSGNLSQYQKARGIDTSKRKRLE